MSPACRHLRVLPWGRHRRGRSGEQPDLREPPAVPRCPEAAGGPGLPAVGPGLRPVGHRQPVGTGGHAWGRWRGPRPWGHGNTRSGMLGTWGYGETSTWRARDMRAWDIGDVGRRDMGTQTHGRGTFGTWGHRPTWIWDTGDMGSQRHVDTWSWDLGDTRTLSHMDTVTLTPQEHATPQA